MSSEEKRGGWSFVLLAVATIVLGILGTAEAETLITLLGIGLFTKGRYGIY